MAEYYPAQCHKNQETSQELQYMNMQSKDFNPPARKVQPSHVHQPNKSKTS